MSTKICTIKEWNRICTDLLNCQVVGFPTETVYGLGIIADSQKAFDALVSLKQRPITKPMTVMVKDVDEIEKYAFVNEKQKNVMQQFMPGPITIILKAKPNLPFTMTLGQSTIGFRIPNHELTLKILKQVRKPLLVTSANLSSMPCFM